MNKIVISIILLLSINIISNAQEIRIKIKDTTSKPEYPELFIVNETDTIKLNVVNQCVFKVDSASFGNTILLKYKSITFDLGKLDVIMKSILLDFNQNASKECYTVNRVYGDAVQSNFDYTLDCTELHNIYLCNTEVPKAINKPAVKFRKKENPARADL